MKEKIPQKIILLLISAKCGVPEVYRSSYLRRDFGLRYLNVAYMTYFSMSVIFFTISYNMVDAVKRTLDDFAKLLKTIFEEDDDLKGIPSDNKSNLDS